MSSNTFLPQVHFYKNRYPYMHFAGIIFKLILKTNHCLYLFHFIKIVSTIKSLVSHFCPLMKKYCYCCTH